MNEETNLPKLPNGWASTILADILDSLESGTRPKGGISGITEGIPSIGGEHITADGGFFFDNIRYVPSKFYQEMNRGKIRPKDVLVVKDGATTGRTGFVSSSFPYPEAAVNEHVFILRMFGQFFEAKYLFYWMNSIYGKTCVRKSFAGTAQGGINSSFIVNSVIQIAPFNEQKRIVARIEQLFSDLDDGVEALKKAKIELKRYRLSVLKAAFEGKYLPKEDRNWKVVKIGEIIETINNGYTPKSDKMKAGKGDIPFIKVYNLTFNGKLDFTKNPTFIDKETHATALKRSITYPNDILINIVGPPLGKVSIVPDLFPQWNINQAIVLFRPNERITSKFLSYYMQNPATIYWLTKTSKATAGQYNVKVSTCREIPILAISIEEQNKIVGEIERRLSVAENTERILEKNLTEAERLRQSILKTAFEGKLVRQDLTDEPANVLLVRIKQQKALNSTGKARRRKKDDPNG